MNKFVHESEVFVAALLDHYDIKWEYENTTFILKKEKGIIKKAFCPDFYLPEHDVYIEVTVMKKATRKRRKIDLTKEKFPDINIVLVDREALEALKENHKFIVETLDIPEDLC